MHFVVCEKVETIIPFCNNLFIIFLKTVRKVLNWVYKRGTFSVQNVDYEQSLFFFRFSKGSACEAMRCAKRRQQKKERLLVVYPKWFLKG